MDNPTTKSAADIAREDAKKKELSTLFKFILFVLLVAAIVFLVNGPIKSNFGYEDIAAVVTGGPDGAAGGRSTITPRQPQVIQAKNISTLQQTWTAPTAIGNTYIDDLEKKIFQQSNKHRLLKQASSVSWEDNLAGTARYHSGDMGKRQFFSHVNPDNVGPFFRISKLHRRYIGTGGENILKISRDKSSTDTMAEKIVDLWMNSTGHRQNILNKDYTSLGVGVVEATDPNNVPYLYATQLFGTAFAYMQQGFPSELSTGQETNIQVECVHPDYEGPVGGEIVQLGADPVYPFRLTADPGGNKMVSTGILRAPYKAGVYQLVFHFPLKSTQGSLASAPGPIFTVK